MDPWSSPWNDDPPPSSTSSSALPHALPSSSAADPWAADDVPQATYASLSTGTTGGHASLTLPDSPVATRADKALQRMPSSLFGADAAWGSEESTAARIEQEQEEESNTPTLSSGIDADPWATSQQTHQSSPTTSPADQVPTDSATSSPKIPHSLKATALPLSDGWGSEARGWEDESSATGFGASSGLGALGSLGQDSAPSWNDASSAKLDDAELSKDGQEGKPKQDDDDDVWASEASQRAQRGRQLSADETNELKVAARKLMTSVIAVDDITTAFRLETGADEGWNSLYGPEGSQVQTLNQLSQAPPAIFKPDGSLCPNLFELSHNTAHRARDAIRRTEGRVSRLHAPESSAIWKKQSRVLTKPEWDPDGIINRSNGAMSPVEGAAARYGRASMDEATPSAGPGWAQTTAKEAKPSAASGLFASLFKSRQVSNSSPRPSSTGSSGSQSNRNSLDAGAASAGGTTPTPTPPPVSAGSYRDDPKNIYTDDPTGPDLMNMGGDVGATASSTSTGTSTEPGQQRMSILGRWRKSNLFGGGGAKKPGGFNDTDFAWLDGQAQSSSSLDDSYDFDESLDSPNRNLALASRYEDLPDASPAQDRRTGTSLLDLDPFAPASSSSKPLPPPRIQTTFTGSSSSSSSSTGKSSAAPVPPLKTAGKTGNKDDWGSWELEEPAPSRPSLPSTSSLNRTTSLRVQPTPAPALMQTKSPLSGGPLLPPPPSNRISLPPPPRASGVRSPQQAQAQVPDLLGDFTAPAAPTPAPASKQGQGQGLSAADLSFFDSL